MSRRIAILARSAPPGGSVVHATRSADALHVRVEHGTPSGYGGMA